MTGGTLVVAAEEDQRKVGLVRSRPGVLRSISGLPGSLVRGTVSLVAGGSNAPVSDGDSLADQWLDFLIQQAQAADTADEQSSSMMDQHTHQLAGELTSCVAQAPSACKQQWPKVTRLPPTGSAHCLRKQKPQVALKTSMLCYLTEC